MIRFGDGILTMVKRYRLNKMGRAIIVVGLVADTNNVS